jgi:hypothetical protein
MSRGKPRVISRGFHDHQAGPDLHTDGMPPSADPPTSGGAPSDGQHVQVLGVADIVMTILEARKTMPSATAAAVTREKRGGGFRVRVSLLEDSPSPDGDPRDPARTEGLAAIFVARQLGPDLTDAFGDKDVIILA